VPIVASLAWRIDEDALVLGAVELTLVTPGTFSSRWRMPSAAFFSCA
jgi:hypothetical protein